MILVDGGLNDFLQPGFVVSGRGGVESGIDLKCQIREEGRLTSHQVVTAVSVQDLAIVFWIKTLAFANVISSDETY